jgi:hypothetical protein
MMMRGAEADRATHAINNNQCPDCRNYGFVPGPRGGAGRNIFCANPGCRAGFNVAPLDHVMLVERIPAGGDQYYPPHRRPLL